MNQPPSAALAGRVVLWGTCDLGKPRVRILREGMREAGVDVMECRVDLWSGIDDKSQVRGLLAWVRLGARALCAYPLLVWRYLRLPRHDWVLLAYPAMPDIFVIRVFAWLRGARVAMDWFLSAYDTIVLDRALVPPRHPAAWMIRAVEWLAVRLPDALFMDTQAHARRMEQLFGLERGRCGHVWVGAEKDAFRPAPAPTPADPARSSFRVLFYGQFIPLHGVPVIIEAARKLRDEPIEWIIVGMGQEAPRIRAMLDADPLPAVQWRSWVPYQDLAALIEDADTCLGIFGTSDKAASVIPNKVFQVVAMGRPLITRDSPAIRELLDPTAPCAVLVAAGDSGALADAVLQASRRRGAMGAERCHAGVQDAISPLAVAAQLTDLLAARAPRGAAR